MRRTLFPDQVELLDKARDRFRAGDRSVLLLAPTGFGKTVVGAEMVSNSVERGKVVWFLNHRRELIRGTSRTFYEQNIPHGIIAAGHPETPSAAVQVCSVATVLRRLGKVAPPSFIITDEAHHVASASWSKIVDYYPSAHVLGLTATPWRLDGTGLGHWFQSLVEGPPLSWLIANGRLSPYRLFAPSQPDLAAVKTVAGDFEKSTLAKAMDRPAITGDAVAHYKNLAAGRRAVVFCVSIEHSKNVAAQFREAGVPAAHIDGTMDDERDAAFQAFEQGCIHVLCNVDLISEGVDVPGIECVILLRPTKSLTHYLQSIGRGLRLSAGKSECIILDHAGNSLTHGLPDDEREWSLEDREKRKKAAPSEVPVKQCSECFFVFRPAPKCPSCGHVPPVVAREIEVVEGELAEVRREQEQVKRQRRLEESDCHTLDDWRALAMQRGYKMGWAMHRWQARQRRAA